MKKNIRIYSLLIALLVISLCLLGCGATPFDRHTELQTMVVVNGKLFSDSRANGKEENGIPLPIELDVKRRKSGYSIVIAKKDGEVQLEEKLTGQEKFLYYNSELGREYVWYLVDESGEKIGGEKRFLTSDIAPRNLYVDGVTNCRDLGGWKTTDGKRIKQGMIYRTSRFNENDSDAKVVTEAGIKTLTEELKIKTELDLRNTEKGETGGITASPLGDGVNYVSVPMRSGGDYLLLNTEVLADVFVVFADKENYPIAFHCSIGTDRTGVIAFLINAMLGVEEKSLYVDYLFSRLGSIGVTRSFTTIDKYLKEIKNAGGNTIAENAYNYLVQNGVPAETLDLMRQMLVE